MDYLPLWRLRSNRWTIDTQRMCLSWNIWWINNHTKNILFIGIKLLKKKLFFHKFSELRCKELENFEILSNLYQQACNHVYQLMYLPTIFSRFYAAEVLIGLEYLHCLGIPSTFWVKPSPFVAFSYLLFRFWGTWIHSFLCNEYTA